MIAKHKRKQLENTKHNLQHLQHKSLGLRMSKSCKTKPIDWVGAAYKTDVCSKYISKLGSNLL